MSSIRLDVKTAFPAGMAELAALRLMNAARVSVSQLLSTGGLVIKAGSSAIVKAGTAFTAIANSKLLVKTANTDMAALAGTVTNAAFNVFCFFVDNAGTLTTKMGTEAATLAAVKFPDFDPGLACIGFIVVNPTGTGDFVGGTTALDDGTVVPNVSYVNTPYPFLPKFGVTLEN